MAACGTRLFSFHLPPECFDNQQYSHPFSCEHWYYAMCVLLSPCVMSLTWLYATTQPHGQHQKPLLSGKTWNQHVQIHNPQCAWNTRRKLQVQQWKPLDQPIHFSSQPFLQNVWTIWLLSGGEPINLLTSRLILTLAVTSHILELELTQRILQKIETGKVCLWVKDQKEKKP